MATNSDGAAAMSQANSSIGADHSQRMTAGEAVVASLIAHGIDTIYALPGVHNDPLFDALFKAAGDIRTVHARHEQTAGYMALGAALATGKPQAYTVVPGPGLLNSAAALLTAYGTNAPVLALIGQIPQAAIGRGFGHLHEIRDQAGILSRLVDFTAQVRTPAEAPEIIGAAMRAMRTGRPGPAAVECAMDVWGRSGPVPAIAPPTPVVQPPIDEDAIQAAAKRLGSAKRVLIVVGGGALDAAAEVTELSHALQAPVLAFRRGRGVLDSRNPFSFTMPIGRELWAEADVVIGIGTRLFFGLQQWGIDEDLAVIRIDADAEEPERFHRPAVALLGDARPIVRRLVDALATRNDARPSRREEMNERQAKVRRRLDKIAPQIAFLDAIRAELGDDGIFVDEVTQIGFAARIAYPVYTPRTFISPGYQDGLGWGYATSLGVQDARRDVPVVSISGDGGFLFTGSEIATAMHHRIPLVTVVFNDGAYGNVKRIQEEHFGGRVIASDLTNPDFVRFAESFGAAAERAHDQAQLRQALNRAFKRRDQPSLIEVPVGPLPSPWEFILMPPVRGPRRAPGA
jgi:acetolactate synthase I/II/III large subunit